jgi:hypothetical protein
MYMICVILFAFSIQSSSAGDKGTICGPSFKKTKDGSCVQLDNSDVLRSLHWLAAPPKLPEAQKCRNVTTIGGFGVCEDLLKPDGECLIWSVISSVHCNAYGALEFEKYWSSRCKVELYHYLLPYKGNNCDYPAKHDPAATKKKSRRGRGDGEGIAKIPEYPNITIRRIGMWATKKYSALYEDIPTLPLPQQVDVLKVHGRRGNGISEDLDGVQYTILSDLFLQKPEFINYVNQVVFSASINTNTLSDNVGRESENAWNMWGTQQLLRDFASFSSVPEEATDLQPFQFSYLLDQARVSPVYSFYHHSFVRVKADEDKAAMHAKLAAWLPATPEAPIVAKAPAYCQPPTKAEDVEMQRWIKVEMNARCHPTRLWVPCERDRSYDAFVPCPEELAMNLAEDYSAMKGWCDFTHKAAEIPQLRRIDLEASAHFQKQALTRAASTPSSTGKPPVRLAFFFTVYADEKFFRRMFSKLYGSHHYYLIHVDPTGASAAYKAAIKVLADEYNAKNSHKNVFVTSDVPIVYGASTATILLTKAMAWFAREARGWDYFVPVTGSDYPLVPLRQLEKMLGHQTATGHPRPFVMAWTPGTSTHIFRLQKTVPAFETDPDLVLSIKAVTDERGRVLGAVPMEYRSTNFGPPLFCNGRKSFYHLDNRRNKSATIMDTQWLFPRDIQPGRGRAYSDWDPAMAIPSFDNGWRIWKKSDPATSGIYDRESVEYIANSEEGRKYYHFFKHMLLGSEEHYYVSLLYNWERTQAFVQTLSAQSVWNTWELGLWEQSSGFLTHTHFLTLKEWPHIEGFARRGMLFARKFNSHKTPELLDKIDSYIHDNASTDAGSMWPGFFEVDTWSPGKIWVAAFRKNQSIAAEARRVENQRLLDTRRGRTGKLRYM